MGCITGIVDNVFFVRWQGVITVADCEGITKAVERAHAQRGEPLIYVATIPPDSPPPDAEARAAIKEGTEYVTQYCSSIHVVIEGEGMRRALIRSVSAGLLLATGMRGKGFHIHEFVEQALESAAARVSRPVDLKSVLVRARAAGYIADPTAARAAT
jgi:hypothetical protein